MSNQFIGQYKITGELGRGGMGVVYKARDEALDRDVAIKVLSDALANDDSVVERFNREAKSMAALNSPHIIQVYLIGEHQSAPFFCMEYVEGESLSERLKRSGKLSVSDARQILLQAAEGLDVAHERGVIHRDIKPGNIMIGTTGRVKLADFGIAMVQDFSKRLTNTGEFVGTPGYLSPEVCIGQPVDHRSDIFALGIVFYEMLTGDIPFTEASPLGMMLEVVKAEIPDIRTNNADIDEQTSTILKRMIAKDPNNRYQSCAELIKDLQGTSAVVSPDQQQNSSAFASAATTALSQLEAMPDLALSSSNNHGPDRASDMIASKPQGGSKVLPWAVAAILILSAGGATTFLFRDKLFNDGQATASTTVSSGSEATVADISSQSSSLFDSISADPGNTASSSGQATVASAGDSQYGGTQTQDVDQDQGDISDAELDAQLRLWQADNQELAQQSTSQDDSSRALAMNDPVSNSMDDLVRTGTKVPASQVDTVSPNSITTTPANNSTGSEPVQMAKVDPEPVRNDPPATRPRVPKVVVMAIGDRAIASPIEQLIEDELSAAGIRMLDESFVSGIGRFASESGVDMGGLADLLTAEEGDVLVLVEVDFLGETPLQYYGQTSTLYSVNVKVSNVSLIERRPMGRGWSQKVDFTSLNANEKAREAVDPMLSDLVASLGDYRE